MDKNLGKKSDLKSSKVFNLFKHNEKRERREKAEKEFNDLFECLDISKAKGEYDSAESVRKELQNFMRETSSSDKLLDSSLASTNKKKLEQHYDKIKSSEEKVRGSLRNMQALKDNVKDTVEGKKDGRSESLERFKTIEERYKECDAAARWLGVEKALLGFEIQKQENLISFSNEQEKLEIFSSEKAKEIKNMDYSLEESNEESKKKCAETIQEIVTLNEKFRTSIQEMKKAVKSYEQVTVDESKYTKKQQEINVLSILKGIINGNEEKHSDNLYHIQGTTVFKEMQKEYSDMFDDNIFDNARKLFDETKKEIIEECCNPKTKEEYAKSSQKEIFKDHLRKMLKSIEKMSSVIKETEEEAEIFDNKDTLSLRKIWRDNNQKWYDQFLEEGIQSSDMRKYIQENYSSLRRQFFKIESMSEIIDSAENINASYKEYLKCFQKVLMVYKEYSEKPDFRDPILLSPLERDEGVFGGGSPYTDVTSKDFRFQKAFVEYVRLYEPEHPFLKQYKQALEEDHRNLFAKWKKLDGWYNSSPDGLFHRSGLKDFVTAYENYGKGYGIADGLDTGPDFKEIMDQLSSYLRRIERWDNKIYDDKENVQIIHDQLKDSLFKDIHKGLFENHDQDLHESWKQIQKQLSSLEGKHGEIDNYYNEHIGVKIDGDHETRYNFAQKIVEYKKLLKEFSREFENLDRDVMFKRKTLESAASLSGLRSGSVVLEQTAKITQARQAIAEHINSKSLSYFQPIPQSIAEQSAPESLPSYFRPVRSKTDINYHWLESISPEHKELYKEINELHGLFDPVDTLQTELSKAMKIIKTIQQ